MEVLRYIDDRGWSTNAFFGSPDDDYQWYLSSSIQGVFRGFHGALEEGVEKTVFVLEGSIIDYAVKWHAASESWCVSEKKVSACAENSVSLFSDEFHGFYVTSEVAVLLYKLPIRFVHTKEQTFSYKGLNYNFPFEHPIMSDKDKEADSFPNQLG